MCTLGHGLDLGGLFSSLLAQGSTVSPQSKQNVSLTCGATKLSALQLS